MAKHKHDWRIIADPAIGVYEKRDCPGNKIDFQGRVETCQCGAGQFVPIDSRLQTVEIASDQEVSIDEKR